MAVTPVSGSDRRLYALASEVSSNKQILEDFDNQLRTQHRQRDTGASATNSEPGAQTDDGAGPRVRPQRAADPSDQRLYNMAADRQNAIDRQNTILDLEDRAARLDNDIQLLGTSSPSVTQALQQERDEVEAQLAVLRGQIPPDWEQRVEAVQDAYDNGGTQSALAALKDATEPAETNPVTAALIVNESEQIIGAIVDDLAEPVPQHGHIRLRQRAEGEKVEDFADLSAVLDSAARSPDADDLIARAADRYADGLPDDVPDYVIPGVANSVGEGNGAALPLAVASSLTERGQTERADQFLASVNEGVDTLRTDAEEEVSEFLAGDFADVASLASWGSVLGPENGQTAADGLENFLTDNPEIEENIDRDLREVVGPRGYQIMRAIDELAKYGDTFEDSENFEPLFVDQFNGLVNGNREIEFAKGANANPTGIHSEILNDTFLGQGEDGTVTPSTPYPGWFLRTIRASTAQLPELSMAGFFDSGRVPPNTPRATALNAGGLATYPLAIYGVMTTEDRQLTDNLYGVQYTLASGKEFVETLASARETMVTRRLRAEFPGLSYRDLGKILNGNLTASDLRDVFPNHSQAQIDDLLGAGATPRATFEDFLRERYPDLPEGQISELLEHQGTRTGNLARIGYGANGLWNTAGKALSIYGGGVDAIRFFQELGNRDFLRAGLYGLSVAGTVGPVVAAKIVPQVGSALGPWGTVAGLVAAGGLLSLAQYDRVREANHMEGPTADFLQIADPELDERLAEHLGNHTGQGESIVPRLHAVAEALEIPTSELYEWIKDVHEDDPDFIPRFVESGLHQLERDENGNFIVSDPHGNDVLITRPRGQTVAQGVNTIDGLRTWAEIYGHPLPNS